MQYDSLDKLFILRIVILGCLHLCGIAMWGEGNHDIDLKHKAYIKGDTVQLSGVEILGYKDFNGCRIVDNYNIIDSCYMEIGDDKTIDVYHLAILSLSPEEYTKNEESDRLLLSIVNGQPRIYDNVLVNNGATYSYECERFVFPTEEMASFNSEYDFALEYWGGQGYKIGWNIGVKAKGENLYVVGLIFWEHNPSLTYNKTISFEYEVGDFPLEEYRQSMIEMVRNDKNPWHE